MVTKHCVTMCGDCWSKRCLSGHLASSILSTETSFLHLACVVVCQELLTRNKSASAEFLEANYDKFFSHYQNLLSSDNYVTRRQALKVTCLFIH